LADGSGSFCFQGAVGASGTDGFGMDLEGVGGECGVTVGAIVERPLVVDTASRSG
jgi:hypothetical protein